jgi:NAD(P)-dependent dehydrogenase (short-subunit alcohol dehydrogenase family)
MQRVNPEGLYAIVQFALPHLRRSTSGGRIVVVSPPIYSRFFRGKTAYAMGKVGMSVLTKGLAMDFEREGLSNMAITSIWPAVVSSMQTLFIHSSLCKPLCYSTNITQGHRICSHGTVHSHESLRSQRPSQAHHIFRRHSGHPQSTPLSGQRRAAS